jgi:hypothetical protein
MGVPLHNAYFLLPTLDNTDAVLWTYAGLAKVSATDGTTHADITRASGGDYTGTDAALWNGGNFGGITVLNNGVDTPQAWISPSLGTRLVNLANWPASTTARVVRPLGRFLVALDVTASGVRKSQLVKWSNETDIGTVPDSWDITDPTRKAGEWPLLETAGQCIDLLPMGERGIIYKSDSIHTMTRVSGVFVWGFKQVFDIGALAQRCMINWLSKHYVATQDDVVMHNGSQAESVLDDRMQRWYAGRVDQDNAFRSFMALNYSENEIWTCIPESGNKFPNIALITNVKDGTTTVQDLPAISHIDWGRPPGTSQVYDSFTIPFDSMVGYFGQSVSNAARKRMIAVAPLAERNQVLQSENAATTWALNEVNTGNHYVLQDSTKVSATAGDIWTFSVKAKADGYDYLLLRLTDPPGNGDLIAQFQVSTGVVLATSSDVGVTLLAYGASAADADGYRRFYVTGSVTNHAQLESIMAVFNSSAFSSFAGDGTSGIRVKEMQLRKGTLGTYQTTTTLPATSAFFLLDAGLDLDGVAFTQRAERTGLAVIGQTRAGEPKSDISLKKLLTLLYPKMQMISGTSVRFYVGMQETINGAVLWTGPFTFTPATDLEIYPDIEGRLIAVALETSNREAWRWDGYDIEVMGLGSY